ncbi:MAG: NUDIX domain-containing protein [Succinivibrio sp.]|jgi:phosphatase NudJ|nr:NUDIX domain-containing protein [Succinivibrio sp.]
MAARFKPNSTVALIIEHQGKFLMVEELNEDQGNRRVFGMPSGHIEAKESILDAAVREGREETGCEVELLSLTGIYDYVKDYETIERFCFEARLKEIPERLLAADPDHEILSVAWYTREEIYAKKDLWRTRLVGLCMDDYFKGARYPLSIIHTVLP